MCEIAAVEGLSQTRRDGVALLDPILPELNPTENQSGDDRAGADDLGNIGDGAQGKISHDRVSIDF